MSVQLAVYHTDQIPLGLVEQIARELTRRGSVTQREMHQLAQCKIGNSPSDLAPDYFVSLATTTNPYSDSLDCIGWASASLWENIMCLQAFVAPNYRNIGLASALATCLIADNHLSQEMPLGVFADEMARVAVRLKFTDIRRYRRCDDGWVRSERLFDDVPEPRGVIS